MIITAPHELELLREGGKKLGVILQEIARMVCPGILTKDLDALAEKLIIESGGAPSFKGYRVYGAPSSYPGSLCVSINEEVVHGMPSDRILQEGDVVGLDIGMHYKGFFTDTALTVMAENNKKGSVFIFDKKKYLAAQRLIQKTKEALDVGMHEAGVGVPIGTIGHAIQKFLENQKLGVVHELVGHGVGRAVHEDPEIPNWGNVGQGYKLHEGEVIAIEPMATLGSPKVKILKDGWTWVTADQSLAAHFEHTMVITKNGIEILTLP